MHFSPLSVSLSSLSLSLSLSLSRCFHGAPVKKKKNIVRNYTRGCGVGHRLKWFAK
jgi:hypothetical protein